MNGTRRVVLLLLGCAALGCNHYLQPSDLAVAPVWYQADTTTILATLGKPLRRDRKDYGEVLGWLETWYYPHLVLTFQSSRLCAQISLVDSALATSRGVRVGDPIAKVITIYGRPAGRAVWEDTTRLSYDGPQVWQALTFLAVRDTVRTVVIGQRAFVFM